MDALLARYIDGDLAEHEVTAFLEAVEKSPALEGELRAYEAVLAMALESATVPLASAFTDRVMADVAQAPRRPQTRAPHRKSRAVYFLAAAAAVVLLFGGGWFTARQLAVGPTAAVMPGSFVTPAAWTMTTNAASGAQYVRLVYRPVETAVDQVSVAGSFNGWDPSSIPMAWDGKVWSAVLVLPPGSYEYMFVEDGHNWVTDPLAPRARSDGFGGVNAVLDITA